VPLLPLICTPDVHVPTTMMLLRARLYMVGQLTRPKAATMQYRAPEHREETMKDAPEPH